MINEIDCKEAEKMIPAFLQDELEVKELADFVEHVESCPECKEELTIQFLVAEGMEQLEAGNNFNLQRELFIKLEAARHHIKVNQTLHHVLLCLEALVVLAVTILICVFARL